MAKGISGNRVTARRIGDVTRVQNQNPLPAAAKEYSHIRVQLAAGGERSLLLTDAEVQRALRRAKRNPEDCPKISWLRDALD
jgi:hypothetical protein